MTSIHQLTNHTNIELLEFLIESKISLKSSFSHYHLTLRLHFYAFMVMVILTMPQDEVVTMN